MVTFKQLADGIDHRTYTDEQYQQCVDFLGQAETMFSYANFIIVGSETFAERRGQACHAAIGNGAGVDDIRLVGTQFGLNKGFANSGGDPSVNMREFARWIMNESHFSHLMVNRPEHRTVEWLLNGGGFIVSSELPQPVFQTMMILSRCMTERKPEQFDMWNLLVAKGCDPHFAFNICFCVGDKTLMHNNPVVTQSGHVVMFLLSPEAMTNFVKGELGDTFDKISYRKKQSLYGCHELFGGQLIDWTGNFIHSLITNDEGLRKRLAGVRNLDTSSETYRPPNPFHMNARTVPLKPTQVTYQEMFGVVADYVVEKGLYKP